MLIECHPPEARREYRRKFVRTTPGGSTSKADASATTGYTGPGPSENPEGNSLERRLADDALSRRHSLPGSRRGSRSGRRSATQLAPPEPTGAVRPPDPIAQTPIVGSAPSQRARP